MILAIISYKSNLHHKAKQKDSTLFYDKYLLFSAQKLSNSHYIGKAHANIASYFNDIEILDSAFYHYNLSKTYSLKLNDSSNIGNRLLNMGLIQKNQNDFFGSKETITEALQYLHPERDHKYIASSYNTLATNHRKLLNYNDAIHF